MTNMYGFVVEWDNHQEKGKGQIVDKVRRSSSVSDMANFDCYMIEDQETHQVSCVRVEYVTKIITRN